jgi:hypothetical protein
LSAAPRPPARSVGKKAVNTMVDSVMNFGRLFILINKCSLLMNEAERRSGSLVTGFAFSFQVLISTVCPDITYCHIARSFEKILVISFSECIQQSAGDVGRSILFKPQHLSHETDYLGTNRINNFQVSRVPPRHGSLSADPSKCIKYASPVAE